ncbi:DUF6538 domain-containing protein [Sulfitobacter sediminilitoris]|uniref:DUF6538 domain-containing protein n=1 Tax=Sulfitobacter sediminilitoris TaxID=2698830 RepID=UPI0038B43DF4
MHLYSVFQGLSQYGRRYGWHYGGSSERHDVAPSRQTCPPKKGGNWQAQMTVPKWAGESFGRTQIRLSTGTTDERIADARIHDIEAQMRRKIMRKFEASTLWNADSPYR